MAFSAGDLIAELKLDRDPFQRGLVEARAEAARFGDIESRLDIAGLDEAKLKLAEFQAALSRIDGEDVSADVHADIVAALAELELVQAKLSELDGETANVNVDVDRTLASRLEGVFREAQRLTPELGGLGTEAESAGGGFSGLGGALAAGAGSLGGFVALAVPAIGVITSLAAAVTALVASAAAAAAGLGALAIAAGSLLAPALVLGIGAIQRFKAQAGQAGTAAYALAQQAGKLGDAFAHTLAPAADAVFRGLADAARSLLPLVRSLQPAFTAFGQAVGDAFRTLGAEFARPAWQQFFSMLARAAAQVTPLLTRSFIAFAQILRNIATAAMPLLIQGLKVFADALHGIAQGTSDIGQVQTVIGALVSQLQSWFALIGAVGRVLFGIFVAAAGPGQQLVDWLTQGANALADWISSAEGSARIAQFFADTLPLAQQLVVMVGALVTIFLGLGQAISPALAQIAGTINGILGQWSAWINSTSGQAQLKDFFSSLVPLAQAVLGAIADLVPVIAGAIQALQPLAGASAQLINALAPLIAAGLKALIPVISVLAHVIAPLVSVLAAVVDIFNHLGPVVQTVVGALLDAGIAVAVAADSLGPLWAVLAVIGRVLTAVIAVIAAFVTGVGEVAVVVAVVIAAIVALLLIFGKLDDVARAVWGAVKAAAVASARAVAAAWNGTVAALGAIWHAILGVARTVWNAIKAAVHGAVRATVGAVRSAWRDALGVLRGIWNAIKALARAIWAAIKASTVGQVRAAVDQVKALWKAAAGAVRAIWGALRGVARATWGAIKGAIVSAVRATASAVSAGFNAMKSAAIAIFHAVLSAARSIWSQIKGAVSDALHAALGVITGLAGAFFSAGAHLMQSLASGIASQASAVIDKVRSIASDVVGILPFSEPRDPTSPLRGLGKAGEAIVRNIAAGIDGGPLREAMAAAFDGMPGPSAPAPDPVLAELHRRLDRSAGGGGRTLEQHLHFHMLYPDAQAQAMVARAAAKGFSAQGYRPGLRETVG